MKDRSFALGFLGFFLLVVVLFFGIFMFFNSRGIDDDSMTVLWSALTILILLFGIIGISLFLNRHKH